VGCAASPAPAPAAPSPVAAPPAAEAPSISWPALAANEPAADAPAQLAQFGQLVGVWSCSSEQRGPDGTFTPGKNLATWSWFYTLGGRVVQDIWEPQTGPAGTNIRVYDAKSNTWRIQWTTGAMSDFQAITAQAVDDTIVMRTDSPAGGKFPAHTVRITFFDMTADKFEWKYEAGAPGTDGPWQEQSRLHCTKTRANPLAR